MDLDGRTGLLLGCMYAVLLGNWALYAWGPLHPVVHVGIGALGIHMAFTIWHEAVHGTVSRRQWVNDVVGVAGMLPYLTPYFIQRWVHLEHHRNLNQPDDPNVIYTSGSFATILLRYPKALGYAKQLLQEDPRTRRQWWSDTAMLGLVGMLFAAAVLTGHLFALLVLWILPVAVAKVVMDWYINYLPHVGLPADRFRGTRILDVGWFTPLVLGHNYHAIHHLWPPVPWHRYRSVYRSKLEYLKKNGVPIERRVLGGWEQSPRVRGEAAVSD